MQNKTVINIGGEAYTFVKNFREQDALRHSLNYLTKKTFGFDFERWYQAGFWGDKYRPYSLVHQGEIVANVSVNTIDFLMDNKLTPTIQIGTVMTVPDYRNRGLIRFLMDIVLEEYEGSSELIYLYANDSVLNFYPKFGFQVSEEYIYTKTITRQETGYRVKKLNLRQEKDLALAKNLVETTLPTSKYSMVGNPGLVMFYLTSFLLDNVYYIPELELLAVVEYEDDGIKLTDVFCPHSFDLEKVMNALLTKTSMDISLGFTPKNTEGFQCKLLQEEGTTFFIKGNNQLKKGRFPELSHA